MNDPIVDALCAKLQARSAVGPGMFKPIFDETKMMPTPLPETNEAYKRQSFFDKLMKELKEDTQKGEEQLTKTPENVTCENLSNADEKSLKNWVFAWAADVKGMPLNSEINDLIWVIEKHVKEQAALQSPRVPVIEGLDEAISTIDYERTDLEKGRIELAAIRYAELQKGN